MASKVFIYICLFLIGLFCSQSQLEAVPLNTSIDDMIKSMLGISETNIYDVPDVDWNTLNFKVKEFKTKEINLSSTDLFAKINKCVQLCKQSHSLSLRDNCVSQKCDIY